jgi:hypothetical protein
MQGLAGDETCLLRGEKNRRWAVSVRPGAMALTLMRCGANSSTIARVVDCRNTLIGSFVLTSRRLLARS